MPRENLWFVGGAYAVMWISVIGYYLRLRSLDRAARAALGGELSRRIEELDRRLVPLLAEVGVGPNWDQAH